MKEKEENKQAKKGKSKNLTPSIKISRNSYEILDEFRLKNKMTMKDLIDVIATFMEKPNFSMAIFDERYELHQMNTELRENNKLTNANFRRFTDDFLSKMEKNHSNNLDFLKDAMPKIIKIGTQQEMKVMIDQIYKLSKALVTLEMEEKDAKDLLNETERTINEFKKNEESQKTIEQRKEEPKSETKEYLFIEGIIEKNPDVQQTANKNAFYCIFTLAENTTSKEPVRHLVIVWEGDLTRKLGLTDQDKVKTYFNRIKTGDVIKLKGYITNVKFSDKDRNENFKKTFVATDIISHYQGK